MLVNCWLNEPLMWQSFEEPNTTWMFYLVSFSSTVSVLHTTHYSHKLSMCSHYWAFAYVLLCSLLSSFVSGRLLPGTIPSAITSSTVPFPLWVITFGATCGWLPLPSPSTAQTVLQFLQFLFSCLSPQFTCGKFKQRLDLFHLSNLGTDLFIFAMIEVFNNYSLD